MLTAPETPVKQSLSKDRNDKDKRLARCGRCVNCKSQDCGSCYNCADKPKFGGPGIKKQACVQRKCLLMVPRDEDGEKLARKRAKQRTLPPPLHRMSSGSAPTPDELAFLAAAANSPLPHSPTRSPSFASLPSPRSEASSPQMSGMMGHVTPEYDVPVGSAAARAQQLSEQALFSLALDDDDDCARGSALTSAMLFAAIRTPHTSPLRPSARAPEKAADKAADKADKGDKAAGEAGGPLSPSSKRKVELDLDDTDAGTPDAGTPSEKPPAEKAAKPPSAAEKAHAEALSAAFTAHIAAKLELDEPPRPPRLDELHEEFLLLNAEHRRADESESRVPILAF